MKEIPNLNDAVSIIKNAFDIKKALSRGNISGLDGFLKALFVSAILDEVYNRSVLIISKNSDESEQFADALKIFISDNKKNIYRYNCDDIDAKTACLNALSAGQVSIVLASQKDALRMIPSKKEFASHKINIDEGAEIEIKNLIGNLVKIGYERTTLVENPGEFAVRGGITDIFSFSKKPVRVEFGPEKIESLREFDPISQLSKNRIKKAEILPSQILGSSVLPAYFESNDLIVMDNPKEFEIDCTLPKNIKKIELHPLKYNENSFFIEANLAPSFQSNMDEFISYCKKVESNCFIVSKQADRIKELFLENDISNPIIRIIRGEIPNGFVLSEAKLSLFSDAEIFGEHIPRRRFEVPQKTAPLKKQFSEFAEGDFVVHKNYGIGIYKGIVLQEIDNAVSDYILIQYAGLDKLYIPIYQMHLVSKYSAPGDFVPKLNKLGTAEWVQTKKRAQNSIKKIAENLAEIYSTRKNKIGIPFSKDTTWQTEFESAFPYEETLDQIKAVNAAKSDMESKKPMDRIICGDVGWGKTEVALRTVFKAVSCGYQAAVIAPTTILCDQHYHSFKERFAPFPFVIKMLSRFVSKDEQNKTIKEIGTGVCDVVIGTHRLIQKDIKFKNLGLLVVDEEQKFGVSHKEKIKNIKKNIDVLTLTATPIPRTLYMSLSGIWDLSMIGTPPPGRQKVETCVMPWNTSIIKQAFEREIDRGGQIYFVHNRIESIYAAASKIQKIFPNLKIAVAHGRMNERILEETMMDFIDRKYDVLVCTAIIESGLDIPNVNTIIIEDPHKFGLSTLYQLRGRVGRSTVKAYSYFLYNKSDILTQKSRDRLSAIKSFTELGSGYKIAMKDLEIRGAGDILGARQHGHMANIGFDLYCEMLDSAAYEIKGIPVAKAIEIVIDLKDDAHIPKDYINDDIERIAIYKRLNIVEKENELLEIRKEIIDRFGSMPNEIVSLIDDIKLKLKANIAGISSIVKERNVVLIEKNGSKYRIDVSNLGRKQVLEKIENFMPKLSV